MPRSASLHPGYGTAPWNTALQKLVPQGLHSGCDARPITDIRAFVDQYVPTIRPGAGITEMRLCPDLAQEVERATVNGPADEGLMKFVGESMENNPAYMRRLEQHYQEKGRLIAQATQRKLAANRAYLASRRSSAGNWKVDTTGSEILDIQKGTYDSTSAMRDAGQARSVDMIHERKPWLNNEGKTVYMPQQYQRACQLPNDVYAGTNDAFFNPVPSFGQFAEPMQPGAY